jgi:DNA primase
VGQEGGAERMRALLERSMRFERFAVERILERAKDDEALGEVGGIIRPLAPGILRDDLVKLASSRLGISPDLVESAVRTARPATAHAPAGHGSPAPAARPSNGARQALDRREQSERAFLALCVALPELGEQKLATVDRDALFTSPLTRLAAERLQGHLDHPAAVIGDTPELAELIPEIVLRAGQLDATPATLELEALQLDLHRLDREITAARTGAEGEVGSLALERQKVLDAIRHRLQ